jgi:hypothetical protein
MICCFHYFFLYFCFKTLFYPIILYLFFLLFFPLLFSLHPIKLIKNESITKKELNQFIGDIIDIEEGKKANYIDALKKKKKKKKTNDPKLIGLKEITYKHIFQIFTLETDL